ncbi:oocyte zinc finger protein XlCOF28 isoform X3 [Oryzias latipes]|uniref:oocyte zinc finger protein XlCOF28 isoform X3 n=1 Tax=Oryzias latipes TaxID=8090 RepID=UPI0005CB9107|nr:oocyte zinc finger protein XlCOF28 isoform X3 [Oryzias latipes]
MNREEEEADKGDDCEMIPPAGGAVPDARHDSAEEAAPARGPRPSKPRHRCSECGQEFSRPSRLADHVASHSGVKRHSCSICGKRFTKKFNLRIHQRVHTGEKPYSCPDCSASFAQQGCLRRHRLQHAAKKPHLCSECGRGFTQRRYLVQHERTHTGEKPFSCLLCPKRFASRNGLVDHHKTHAEQKLFSCSLCQKAFSSASSFRDHVRLHTGQKLHPCSLCSRSFNRPSKLRGHLQRHADEAAGAGEAAPHCFLCQEDFSSIEQLQEHRRLQHPAPRFACSVCGRTFTRTTRLKVHMKSHSAGGPQQNPEGRRRGLKAQGKPKKNLAQGCSGTATPPQESSPAEGKRRGEEEEALSAGEEESAGDVRAPLQMQHLLRCSTCSKTFSRPGSLRAHQRSHQAQTLHACSICSRGFRKPCLLRKHMRSHVREGLMAEPADKGFWQHMKTGEKKALGEEEQVEAVAPQEDSAPKPPTSKAAQPGNHGDHINGLINSDGEEEQWTFRHPERRADPPAGAGPVRRSKHLCPVCGRDCFKASALQKHLRIHSGERPYQCPTCSKSFVQQVHMKEHQRIHTGEKPFTCPQCAKSFTFSSALRRHQRLHDDARPFCCHVCKKSFKQRSVLKSHLLTHSGVRYQCPLCSRSFSRALELTYHVDVHSEARPYFCSICNLDLSGARIFRNHMRKHESAGRPAGSEETM